jgi:hypothetical protein
MPEMPKGLLSRLVAVLAGIVVIVIVAGVAHLSSDSAGIIVLLYVFAAPLYLAGFLVKHEDEIPTRSNRD